MLRLPGEWEAHDATWITWPCRTEIWPDYSAACQAYADVINAVASHERVYLIVNPEYIAHAEKLCTRDNVVFVTDFQANDSWSRDTSPVFLLKGNTELRASCWQFNAWGEKFIPYDRDAKLAKNIAQYLNISFAEIPMVLEGGSIHANGQGTLLVTKECLLNTNRNPHLTQTQIEKQLKETLNIQNIIWLNRGIDGDVDTDGHIDNAACFSDEHSIIIQSCYDLDDLNSNYFHENKMILKESKNAQGKSFIIHEIPQPPRTCINNERVPFSYINFYFANDAIILPTFNSPKTDDTAKEIFKDIFPKRHIHSINATPIVHGGGGIHCITMQQPKVKQL